MTLLNGGTRGCCLTPIHMFVRDYYYLWKWTFENNYFLFLAPVLISSVMKDGTVHLIFPLLPDCSAPFFKVGLGDCRRGNPCLVLTFSDPI